MKIQKLLILLSTLALLVGCAFAIGVSADEDDTPRIVSKNLSYGDCYKFKAAVPKDLVKDELTFTVSDGVSTKSSTLTVAELEALGSKGSATIDGIECYTILSSFGVAAKDMAKVYTLTVTSNGKTSDPITYSVAEYLNERLFKNGIVHAEEGTPDGYRKALYFSTLEYGKNAEMVLCNLDSDENNDIVNLVDTLLYSNLAEAPAIYSPGSSVTVAENCIATVYKFGGSEWTAENRQLVKGDVVTLDGHYVISDIEVKSEKGNTFASGYLNDFNLNLAPGKNAGEGDVQLGTTVSGKLVPGATKNTAIIEAGQNEFSLKNSEGKYYHRFSIVNNVGGRVGNVLEFTREVVSGTDSWLTVPTYTNENPGGTTYVIQTDIYLPTGIDGVPTRFYFNDSGNDRMGATVWRSNSYGTGYRLAPWVDSADGSYITKTNSTSTDNFLEIPADEWVTITLEYYAPSKDAAQHFRFIVESESQGRQVSEYDANAAGFIGDWNSSNPEGIRCFTGATFWLRNKVLQTIYFDNISFERIEKSFVSEFED